MLRAEDRRLPLTCFYYPFWVTISEFAHKSQMFYVYGSKLFIPT